MQSSRLLCLNIHSIAAIIFHTIKAGLHIHLKPSKKLVRFDIYKIIPCFSFNGVEAGEIHRSKKHRRSCYGFA